MENGTLTYNPDTRQWVIECVPHVAMMLRRIFPRIGGRVSERYAIEHNESTAHMLRWFLDMYPLALEDADRAQLLESSQKHVLRQQRIASVLDSASSSEWAASHDDYVARPFELALPARDYQIQAAELALTVKGMLLADDVGVGKTVSAICAMASGKYMPVLVVCYPHLQRQWQQQIERFAPGMDVEIIKKSIPYDLTRKKRKDSGVQMELPLSGCDNLPDVIICTYHKLSGWAETLAPVLRGIVFDEVQELRLQDSNKYSAARYICERVEFRLGLSATPVYNHGGEMWTIMNLLSPGFLGSWPEFSREWCSYADQVTEPRALGAYLREQGLMLRRTRKDVARELPGVQTQVIDVDVDHKPIKDVSARCRELAELILKDGNGIKGEAFHASQELSWKLRQATGVAKAASVVAIVKMLLEGEQKIVLFGWHREVYLIWMEMLREYNPVMYTGSETAAAKDAAIKAFATKDDCRVLIISLRSGAGIDGLQHCCRTVVFGELDWSPGVHEQCIGRVNRDGQTDPVSVYYVLATDGSDPVVANTLNLKAEQSSGIRDPHADLVEELEVDPDRVRSLAKWWLERNAA